MSPTATPTRQPDSHEADDYGDISIEDLRLYRKLRRERFLGPELTAAVDALDAATRSQFETITRDTAAAVMKLAGDIGEAAPPTPARPHLDDAALDFADGDDDLDAEVRRLFGDDFVDRLNREADAGHTEGLRIEFTTETRDQLRREIALLQERREQRKRNR